MRRRMSLGVLRFNKTFLLTISLLSAVNSCNIDSATLGLSGFVN